MVRMNLVMTDELAKALEELAAENETSKSEILRRALTLYEVAREGKKRGQQIGLGRNGRLETEIVGV
jgi:predicted transcriptional regulator